MYIIQNPNVVLHRPKIYYSTVVLRHKTSLRLNIQLSLALEMSLHCLRKRNTILVYGLKSIMIGECATNHIDWKPQHFISRQRETFNKCINGKSRFLWINVFDDQ